MIGPANESGRSGTPVEIDIHLLCFAQMANEGGIGLLGVAGPKPPQPTSRSLSLTSIGLRPQ